VVTTAPVTIEQAAAILGVSASTIRRRIKAGALRVEEARRPQGVVWLVHLPPGTGPASETATVDTAPVTTTASSSHLAGDAIAAMIAATLTPIIAPLVGELAASRQANERLTDQLMDQAEMIRQQAEVIGTLRAENDALEAQTEAGGLEPTGRPLPILRRLYTQWWMDWLILATLTVVAFALWLSR
jgi:hypothetical protein